MKNFLFATFITVLLASCHESLEKRAEREAEEFTRKNCPMPVGEFIINDSMTYEKDTRTVHYYYTITGKADTSAIYTPQTRAELVKGVIGATSLKVYKDNDFNFAYTYYSQKNKGKVLIDVKITPKDYKTANGK